MFKPGKMRIILLFSILILSIGWTKLPAVDDLFSFAQSHKKDLRLNVYVTARQVQDNLSNEAGLREAVSVLRSLGITRAFLETYRAGVVVEPQLLKNARDHLRANGIEVAGGIATVPGKDFGVRQKAQLSWFNWQAPKTQADLERVMRQSAPIFDEFIVDDFMCTGDTSEMSKIVRGNRTWGEYRRDLLVEVAKRIFIDLPKQVNPGISMIIKYPQWYDRFHLFGYDVVRQPRNFDNVWVGTETRGPDTQRMGFVKQYQGFVNYRWIHSLVGNKIAGAWFDHIDCTANDFIDQAFESVLAGAREIMLFNYGNLIRGHAGHHLLRIHFPGLVELAQMVAQNPAKGVFGYKPPNSDAGGDLYIFDYLGMSGIPLVPCSQFPTREKVVFLPTQAAADPRIEPQLRQLLHRGGTAILTVGFLKTQGLTPGLSELGGISAIGTTGPFKAFRLFSGAKTVFFKDGLDLEAGLIVGKAKILLAVQQNGKKVPYLTVNKPPDGGEVFVLNSHTFSEADFKRVGEVLLPPRDLSVLNLPEDWLTVIRQSFNSPLGVLLQSPSRLAVHQFGENNWVLSNFNDHEVALGLQIAGESGPDFLEVFTKTKLQTSGNTLKLKVPKRTYFWLKRL